jgi:hypothetical protein
MVRKDALGMLRAGMVIGALLAIWAKSFAARNRAKKREKVPSTCGWRIAISPMIPQDSTSM